MAGFRGKKFEISITRAVDQAGLEWPSAEERESETLGGNRDYAPLGRIGWSEVSELITTERDAIEAIAQADDWEVAYVAWLEDQEGDPSLFGFDLGTNALSAALAAARCLPFYSCNGGAFEDGHNDSYPLIAFFCRVPIFPFVQAASRKGGTGLEYNHAGGLTVFGQDVEALLDTAAALFDQRAEIDAVRIFSDD